MAKKAKADPDYELMKRRYEKMREREAAGPKRTIGELLDLRLRVAKDIAASSRDLDEVLDEVYKDAVPPEQREVWNPHPRHRWMACPSVWGSKPCLAVLDFGWSRDPDRPETRRWLRCWSKSNYDGYDDTRLIQDITRRTPTTELDALAATFEVSTAFESNDPELAKRFIDVNHRNMQLYYRAQVVKREIDHAVTQILKDKCGWFERKGQKWRRVNFDNGIVLTVTDVGEVLFGDQVEEINFSLSDRPSVRRHASYGPLSSLSERQRRARERP